MHLRPLTAADAAAWQPLWQDYLHGYQASLDAEISTGVWARLTDEADDNMQAVGLFDAKQQLQGFAHVVFHPNTWSLKPCCYLEDLFVATAFRGQGGARALLQAVYALAGERHCCRVYWVTHQANWPARALYDQVATAMALTQYRKDFD